MSGPVWRNVPLTGRVLIEASAGTGKTHQIALLVLRLLLEARQEGPEGPQFLDIGQILVCTFTEAAATELRGRIRARIVEAQLLLERPQAGGAAVDAELQDWLQTLSTSTEQHAALLERLRLARLDFDRAPISTIHGWCARVQRELPFASGSLLGGAELVDESALLADCFADFLRRCTQAPPAARPDFAGLLLAEHDALLQALGTLRNHPDAVLEPPDLPVLEHWKAAQAQLRQSGFRHALAQQRLALLKAGSAFGKRIDELLALPAEAAEASKFSVFDTDSLGKATLDKSRDLAAVAEFSLLLELGRLQPLLGRVRFAQALDAAHHWCTATLAERMQQAGQRSYNQLIAGVRAALRGAGGEALAAQLRAAHPHALIDEFQDTDQQQFEIFERIYGGDSSGTTSLHLIGDPKQAIYGFRGGDLEAYLQAARSVQSRWPIDTNWRAAQLGVRALNRLYALSTGGFEQPAIAYRPVLCGGRLDAKPLRIDGEPQTVALQIHVDTDPDHGNMERQQARVLEACADRIANILQSRSWRIGDRALAAADIAVLAHRHADLIQLRERLVARGVPCASAGRLSLADAPVAAELLLVLQAVVAHDDDAAVRGALATPLLGFDLQQLAALAGDEARWLQQVRRFGDWRLILQRRGVLALVEHLLGERAAEELRHADGERRLTDLRHLGEWLEEQQPGARPAQVLACLRALRAEPREQGDEDRLRTETDALRVQLLTVFAAKGLQFPLVFLPTLWRPVGRPGALLRYHDSDGRLCFDAGSAQFDAHAELAQQESRAESLRTLYVALTRAMYRTELYWCDRGWPPKDGRATGLELLLAQLADPLAPKQALITLGQEQAHGIAVADIVGESPPPHVHLEAGGSPLRIARSNFPPPRPPFVLHSFSGLARPRSSDDDTLVQPAADELVLAGQSEPPTANDLLHNLPHPDLLALADWRGAAFGNASHVILERATDAPLWPDQRALVESALREHGLVIDGPLGTGLASRLAQRLDAVRVADLGAGLRLAELADQAQVREFEFHFALGGVPVALLRHILLQHGQPQLLPPWLSGQHLKGLMTGFIDLVYQHKGRFGVLDYKSNWLGDTLAHYQPQALASAMRDDHYPLQALIYSVALHRYLRQRLPNYDYDRHHAGAVYVYLRAAGLEGASGVCTLRFEAALIEDFSKALGRS